MHSRRARSHLDGQAPAPPSTPQGSLGEGVVLAPVTPAARTHRPHPPPSLCPLPAAGALSGAPALVESITHLTAFRGFAGTSVLIMVGVATDTAR